MTKIVQTGTFLSSLMKLKAINNKIYTLSLKVEEKYLMRSDINIPVHFFNL